MIIIMQRTKLNGRKSIKKTFKSKLNIEEENFNFDPLFYI